MAHTSSSPRSKNGGRPNGAPRPCRDFRARTSNHVRRALADWGYVFGRPAPTFSPAGSCSDVAAAAKKLLGSCPSDDPREVMAWQSIKKSMPASCKCMDRPLMEKLIEGVRRPKRTLPAGYLAFVSSQVRRLFPKGWDLDYESQVLLTSPPLSATTDSVRRSGGCLGSEIDHGSFLTEALSGSSRPEYPRPEAELIVIQSAGKPRSLTKFSSDELLLRPLHKTIYNHISRCKWVMRGDVDDDALARAGFNNSDGVLTSGDYASATDNLSIEVAEVIVDTLLSSSSVVPPFVRERARAILRPFLYWTEGPPCSQVRHDVGVPNVGQMMGSYLSFPLLCLQNRLAFLWAARSSGLSWKEVVSVPCLINGDDILFASSRALSDVWMDTVGGLGLEVERTKTSVDDVYGSLNSTLLTRVGGYLRVVPTLRFGRLRESTFVTSLGKEFSLFLHGFTSNRRFRAAMVWFKWKIGSIRSTRLTLIELGFRGSLAMRMGEIFKLDLWSSEGVVPPSPPVGHNITLSSEEFVRVPAASVTEELRSLSAIETAAWKYRQDFVQCRVRATIRYCMELSQIRRSEPVCGRVSTVSYLASQWAGSRLTNENRRGKVRDAFLQPRESGEKSVAVPLAVLSLQDWLIRDCELPPTYGATVGLELGSRREIGCWTPKKK